MAQLAPNFTTKIEDDYGVYPEAVVAIYKVYKDSNELTEYNDIDGHCKKENVITRFGYEVMFYNDREAALSGKRSRPIIISSESGTGRVIEADLTNVDIVNLMGSGVMGEDLKLQIIQIDIKRHFN